VSAVQAVPTRRTRGALDMAVELAVALAEIHFPLTADRGDERAPRERVP
jgi:hypothetical protein